MAGADSHPGEEPRSAPVSNLRGMLLAGLDGPEPDIEIDLPAESPGMPVGWSAPECDVIQAAAGDIIVQEFIGRGGMGAVYRCYDPETSRTVAVKLLPPELAEHPESARRFDREGKIMAQLHHDHIVQVYRSVTNGSHRLLVMEYVEGEDLAELLRQSRRGVQPDPLPLSEALRIFCEVCSGLQFAHDAGVIHRDIKPNNILVDTAGRAKVADFGLARPVENEGSMMTSAGHIIGVFDYMAPEYRNGGEVNHRMDIFALGVMLYEIIAGRLPAGAWTPPSRERKGADRRLDGIVEKAMQRDPAHRWQKAGEMGDAVAKVRRSMLRPAWQRTAGSLVLPGAGAALIWAGWLFIPWRETPGEQTLPPPPPPQVFKPGPRIDPPGTITNSLGQKLAPVKGMPYLLACIWETRIKDFRAFVDSGYEPHAEVVLPKDNPLSVSWDAPGFSQEPDHPVVCVSQADADAFCRWLTATERASGRIRAGQEYRLLTDREWSAMAAIPPDKEDWQWERKERPEIYSWGTSPKKIPGWENTKGSESAGAPGDPYDRWPDTAPAGSLNCSAAGFYDLGGNAREWVLDSFDFSLRDQAVRSSAFRSNPNQWTLARRTDQEGKPLNDTLGFRIGLDLKTTETLALTIAVEKAIMAFHEGNVPAEYWKRARASVTPEGIRLDLSGCNAGPLTVFSGIPVRELFLGSSLSASDLSPFNQEQLRRIVIEGSWPRLSDLPAARLEYISLLGALTSDAAGTAGSLKGIDTSALKGVCIANHPGFSDLTPLARAKGLRSLILQRTGVSNVSALAAIPLEILDLRSTPVIFSSVARLPLAQDIRFTRSIMAPLWDLVSKGRVAAGLAWLDDAVKEAGSAQWLKGGGWASEMKLIRTFLEADGVAEIASWAVGGRKGDLPKSLWTIGNHHYLYFHEKVPRQFAEWFAALLGGHLATVTSAEESDGLVEIIRLARLADTRIHLGLRRYDGLWRWCTGEKTDFAVWEKPPAPGGPDFAGMWAMAWHPIDPADSRKNCGILIEWTPAAESKAVTSALIKFGQTWNAPGKEQIRLRTSGRVNERQFTDSWWVLTCPETGRAELYEDNGMLVTAIQLAADGRTSTWTAADGSTVIRNTDPGAN